MQLGALVSLGGLLFKILLDNLHEQKMSEEPTGTVSNFSDSLSESVFRILPLELLNLIASDLTSAKDIWPFYFTCRHFQQIIVANEGQHSIVKSPTWIHHYLMNVVEEIGSGEKALLRHVALNLKSALFQGRDIVPLSLKFTDVSLCDQYCHANYLDRRAIIIYEIANAFIPARAKTIIIPPANDYFGSGCIWRPEDPDSADMFKEFKHVGEIVPALINNFQGFSPHLVHKFILPLWTGQSQLTEHEHQLFKLYGKYLAKGLRHYLNLVRRAKCFEIEPSDEHAAHVEHSLKEIGDFLDSMGIPSTDIFPLHPHLGKARKYTSAKQILMIAAHWKMNLDKIILYFPRRDLTDPDEIEDIIASGVLQEPATFENILNSHILQ